MITISNWRFLIMKCDFCTNERVYDAPIIGGSWCNLCEVCFTAKGGQIPPGTKLKSVVEQQPAQKKEVYGVDIVSMEDMYLNDENREVECPICSDTLTLELDASGSYLCTCGVQVKISALI